MPGLVAAVFGSGADGLAAMSAIVGLGAIVSGLWMAQRGAGARLTEMTMAATALSALAIGWLALSPNLAAAMVGAAAAGLAMIVCGVGTQTLLQMAVAGEMRGRVMSLYGMVFRAGPAAGAFVMGLASEWVGLRAPLAVGAALTLLVWFWLWRRRRRVAEALEAEAG
jgi:predicted MFS family arabinose efflux permease